MDFGVLGPLRVITVHGAVRLGGVRLHRMLAILLTEFDRVVSVPELIDAAWDGAPPATARRQVQNAMSALRRQLVDDDPNKRGIVRENNGYRVPMAAGCLDAQAFQDRLASAQRLVEAGQPEQAVTELRHGLGCWRGAAFQGLTGRVIEAAAVQLNEQRLTATEQCLDLELSLGRHQEVTGELSRLVAANPVRARLVGLQMVALHRSGRQADALNAYHAMRTQLADDLGIDPSASLRELYAAILTDDPPAGGPDGRRTAIPVVRAPLAAARPVPAQLPADVAGFTGRADWLAELDRVPQLVVIAGMAGVGKTALAVHWGHRVSDRFPDGQFYLNLHGFGPTGAEMSPDQAIRRLLDALAVPPDRIPADLEAQAGLYRSLLAGRRALIVLDNARDAGQVRPLLPGSSTCKVLVTSRNRLDGLVAAAGARSLTLDLLPTAEAREMLTRRVGPDRVAAEPAAADEIIDCCAGLPLALAIVAAHARFSLAELAGELRDGLDRLDPLAGEDPVTDVRAVFSWSYQTLGASAARLFRLLALHPGPDVSIAAAASMAGLPTAQARRALAELVRAHLIIEHVPRRYTLHDLLRGYAAELARQVDDDAALTRAKHRMFDHYLHSAYAAARREHPHRHPITVDPPQPGIVVDDPADAAAASAWIAAEHPVLIAAVKDAERDGFDQHVWQLAWSVAEFLDRQGYWHEWIATQRSALHAARRVPDTTGQAHAHRALGRAYVRVDRVDDALPNLDQAFALFAALGDRTAQARTHLDLAWALDRQQQYRRALQHAEQALELFRAVRNAPGQADALNAIASYHALVGHPAEALVSSQQALVLHQELEYERGQAASWVRLGHAHQQIGDHTRAFTCYRHAVDLFREIGVRYDEADALAALGDAQDAAGERSAARRTWHEALTILTDLEHPDAKRVRARLDDSSED